MLIVNESFRRLKVTKYWLGGENYNRRNVNVVTYCEGQFFMFFMFFYVFMFFCLIKYSLPFAFSRESFTIASPFNKNKERDFFALLHIMKKV